MILAIGMGSTSTVVGDVNETKAYFVEWVITDQGQTDTEYAMSFKNILEMHQIDIASIEGAILSSVVPPVNSIILSVVEEVTGNRPLPMGPGIETGMNIIMDNLKTIGNDQIVDTVVASHEHSLPLAIVDMGTAIMLRTVDEGGNYIGGVILPGLKVSLSLFDSKMAQLPYVSLEIPSHVIGKNAIDCIRSGVIHSSVDMIDGILDRMKKEPGEPPIIITAGGLAEFITPLCCHKILVDDALLLRRLSILYRKNMRVH